MATESDTPKHEPTPTPLGSIPQKRALDDDHSPAVSSPLNPDNRATEQHAADEAPHRTKSGRAKKDSFKKREAKGTDSARATPDPKPRSVGFKSLKESHDAELSPLRFVAPPKQTDFELSRGPVLIPHHKATTEDGEAIEFFEPTEGVANKRNFRYSHYIGDPLFPSMLYYRQTELEPYGPKLTYEDAASHIFFDSTCRQVTTDKGFRMARANVGVREGRWYWECKVKQGIRKAKDGDSKSQTSNHVRMGWARREASLEAPVGYDAYSYGIRDVTGEKVWMSRPKDFFPPGETIHEGDVIGLEIQLPSERLHRRVMAGTYNPAVDPHEELQPKRTASAANIVRERPAIRHKANNYFESIDYSSTKELEDLMNPSPLGPSGAMEAPNPLHASPSLRTLPGSSIRLYKNGKLMGTAFEDLLGFLPPASKQQQGARDGLDDGSLGYYPAVSVFRGGAAEVNFGPDFWYPPPGYKSTNGDVEMESNGETGGVARPLSERFEEQIAEDVVWDIVDEVDFWMQDGQGPPGSGGMASGSAKAGLTHGRGIAQDD